MANSKQQDLTQKPIATLIKQIAIPASLGFLFHTMYNVVDTFWAGKISTEALAALSISFPVFFIIIAIGNGIGTGATALIANSLGAQKPKQACRYFAQALSFGFFFSLVLTALGLAIAPFLFRLLGAEGNYLSLALEYIDIIFYGSIFFLFNSVLNAALTATGNTKIYRNYLIIAFFLNLLLDPWFMLGGAGLPALGIKGIAWATVLVQLIGTLYLFSQVNKAHFTGSIRALYLRPRWRYYRDIIAQGFPASLNMMTISLGIFIITFFIKEFGQQAVAAYGIATRIDQIAILPNIGLNVAALALIGQNNGAKKYQRVRLVIKKAAFYGTLLTLGGMVMVLLFNRPLMRLFSDDPAVIAIGHSFLTIHILAYLTYLTFGLGNSVLQGLKKPAFPVWIGLYRQIMLPAIFFSLFVWVLHWSLSSIWWGIVLINWSAALITIFYIRRSLPSSPKQT